MYAAFNAWKEKFKENILDMGGRLMPSGNVVTPSGATDGPFVEAKEIVGGYMLVSAEFAGEVADDLLRMLFICCDDAIPRDSRLVLALKTLCGFSVSEIALRLFTSEANVYKRVARARDRLREAPPDLQTPPLETLRSRLRSVHAVLYLLFNEGYLSAHAEQPIRLDYATRPSV